MINNYSVLRKVISKELCDFLYEYLKIRRQGLEIMLGNRLISPFVDYWGSMGDGQVPDTFNCYGDPAMDCLLPKLKSTMEKETNLTLVENYTYPRLYKNGDVLKRHKDRFSCEISTTLYLGGTPWPIYLDPTGKEDQEGTRVDLGIGDMLIYKA